MKEKVTVNVNDSIEIVCYKNENLLRVLEKNGYEIEYECQELNSDWIQTTRTESDWIQIGLDILYYNLVTNARLNLVS